MSNLKYTNTHFSLSYPNIPANDVEVLGRPCKEYYCPLIISLNEERCQVNYLLVIEYAPLSHQP